MSATMTTRVRAYLRHRRALGYRLRIEGELLLQFGRYADRRGHQGPPTNPLMLRWATLPSRSSQLYKARRLEILRPFAKHLCALEAGTEVPPSHILGPAHRRNPPHLYTAEQIRTLMTRAAQLSGQLRPHTYSTLIGLIACTGLRLSEALGLEVASVDLDQGVLTVRESKYRRSRFVPVHSSTVRALKGYHRRRQRLWPEATHFFVTEQGRTLPGSTVHHTFRELARTIEPVSGRATVRIHDLRHTFACRVLLKWERSRWRAAGRVAVLSRYLGHAHVTDTYWYLTATPALLSQAARNFKLPEP